MSPTGVYSLRLPREILKMMEGMDDVNWQSEIRQSVEGMVRRRNKQKLLARAEELRKRSGTIGVSAAQLIREDRDAR